MALVPYGDSFQPPLLMQAEHGDEDEGPPAQQSLEESFGMMVTALMQDEVSVSDAVYEFQEACLQEAEALRHHASQVFNRPAQHLQLRKLASELEGQAASWQLLLHLYCIGENPAGTGGPQLSDVGGERTYRQMQRDAIVQNEDLQRVAQVVSWLESLAAQRLEARQGPHFTPMEGVWTHTRTTARRQPGAGALELDMDAPTRGAVVLAKEDQQNEERVCAALWQLVRAGKIPEVRQLCRQVGQSWRAADLAGAGPYGPLPVGQAAVQQDDELTAEAVAAELAAQVEGGRGAGTKVWKWACYRAAEAAATAAHANKHEAALYGGMCGHVGRVLPVCGGWEDECWAYCRAWLDLAADEAVTGDNVQQQESVSADVLAAAVAKLAGGYSIAAEPETAVQGMQVTKSQWPLPQSKRDPQRTLVPSSFEDLAAQLEASSNPATRAALASKQRKLQTQIITERFDLLVMDMAKWAQQLPLADAAAAEWQGRQEGQSAGMVLLQFAAHMGLALRALGLVQDDKQAMAKGMDMQQMDSLERLKRTVDLVVGRYTLRLIPSPTTILLAPQYLCHLATDMRAALFGCLITAANADSSDASDEERQALYGRLADAFDQWHERQQALQEGGWQLAEARQGMPSNLLFGDVRPEELRLLLDSQVSQARQSTSHSPTERTRLLRWLFYPFLLAQQAPEQDGSIAWQPAFDDALRLAAEMATEFALGPGPISAMLHQLLQQTMPVEFQQYVAASLPALAAGVSDAEDERHVLQLQRQWAVLQYWQRYDELSAQYIEWMIKAAPQADSNSGSIGAGPLLAAGQQLASSLLAFATSDALCAISDPDQDLEDPSVLELLMTGDASWDGGAAVGEYPALSRGALSVLRGQVAAALERATADTPDVRFEVEVQEAASNAMAGPHGIDGGDASAGVSGAGAHAAGSVVLVRLQCWQGDDEGSEDLAAEEQVRRAQRMHRTWGDMARIAAGLLARRARRFGSGRPQLCLVGLRGSVATMAQVARHRSTAKLLVRTAKVMRYLATAGPHPTTSTILDELLMAAAGAAGSPAPQLLGLLRDWDVKKLLQIVEQAMELMPTGASPAAQAEDAMVMS